MIRRIQLLVRGQLRAGSAAAAVLAALSLTACHQDDVVRRDLVTGSGGRVLSAGVVLDAAALAAASDGWWEPESPSGEASFVWARDALVAVELEVAGGGPTEVAVRCRPYQWDGAPPQSLELVVNGVGVGSVKLTPDSATYTFAVPGEAVARGVNRLELRFAWVARPGDHEPGSTDLRTLAAAVEWLAMGSIPAAAAREPAPPAAGGPVLVVAPGSAVVASLWLGPSWSLEVAARAGDAAALAEVWVRVPGQVDAVLVSESLAAGTSDHWRRALDPFAGRVVDIGLTARGGAVRFTAARVVGPPGGPSAPANLILVDVDTLRADYLSCYGGPAATPNLDALAAGGARFGNAYAHAPITGPSHATIFTSLLPSEHRVHNNAHVLDPAFTTLAETLEGAGYATAGFVSLGVLDRRFGLAQGFDHYADVFARDWMKNAEEVNAEVIPWLDRLGDRPFFLWVHYSDPHEPYTPPDRSYPACVFRARGVELGRVVADGRGANVALDLPPGRTTIELVAADPSHAPTLRFPYVALATEGLELRMASGWEATEKRGGPPDYDSPLPATIEVVNPTGTRLSTTLQLSIKERTFKAEIRQRYAAEIEYVDREIGRLVAALAARGFLDTSLVVVIGDHGEDLGEHGHIGHISQVYDHSIRVPLILRFPGRIAAGVVVAERVGLLDLFPTVVETLGLAGPGGLRGRSLLPLVAGQGGELPLVAVTYRPEAASDKRAIIAGGLKYIHSTSEREWEELYDLRADPGEGADLSAERPGEVERLRAELATALALGGTGAAPEQAELSEEDRARLRELGYVH